MTLRSKRPPMREWDMWDAKKAFVPMRSLLFRNSFPSLFQRQVVFQSDDVQVLWCGNIEFPLNKVIQSEAVLVVPFIIYPGDISSARPEIVSFQHSWVADLVTEFCAN